MTFAVRYGRMGCPSQEETQAPRCLMAARAAESFRHAIEYDLACSREFEVVFTDGEIFHLAVLPWGWKVVESNHTMLFRELAVE